MQLNSRRASFAVVGHPNKGKSSIVSTLARNDSIAISRQSGTTTRSSHYRIDTGNAGFELIDTPGFQRPKKVLHWLNQHADRADKRAQAVAKFIEDLDCKKKYPDEVELLTPLVKGSAILYVVDGSRPYGVEYEAEMEILRWTGQPSMALINPIENDSHVEVWRNALSQFFKIVRVFNPLQADFNKQLSLFQAFSHLELRWKPMLDQVVIDLEQNAQLIIHQSAQLLSQLLIDLCRYQLSQKVLTEAQASTLRPVLTAKYNQWMKEKENEAYRALCQLHSHQRAQLSIDALDLPPDLFDNEQWYAWGLNKKQLAITTGMAGAAAGAAVDLAVAGHSFMLGAVGGGLVGFGSAWLGANKLVNSRIKGLPLGGYQAIFGPVSNLNFPYVVIGRFLHIDETLRSKNHADRNHIVMRRELKESLTGKMETMRKDDSKLLHTACRRLVSQKPVANLAKILQPLFLEEP